MANFDNVEIKCTSEITVRLIQAVGGDHMVVAAARVSTTGEECVQYLDPAKAEENAGLIRYLMKHRHGTPFEHSCMSFFVHAPIFVWREWHRHRIGFSYNEESARYKPLDPVFYMPPKARPMFKVENWKPGRPKFLRYDETGTMADQVDAEAKYTMLVDNLKYAYWASYSTYQKNLALGIDPGLARDCLPVGIYSSCWVTCNPRSLMSFLSLRTSEPTAMFPSYPLYEIEVAARACEELFKIGWPITYKAFLDMRRVAP
jgi:thymidylate synthase (FAD)